MDGILVQSFGVTQLAVAVKKTDQIKLFTEGCLHGICISYLLWGTLSPPAKAFLLLYHNTRHFVGPISVLGQWAPQIKLLIPKQ
ncbi:hypothetical protein STEG23_020530, partial [Scotinomys teguina]